MLMGVPQRLGVRCSHWSAHRLGVRCAHWCDHQCANRLGAGCAYLRATWCAHWCAHRLGVKCAHWSAIRLGFRCTHWSAIRLRVGYFLNWLLGDSHQIEHHVHGQHLLNHGPNMSLRLILHHLDESSSHSQVFTAI